MRSILKALGVTIWGIVALCLLSIFLFVGYQAAISHRGASPTLVNEITDQSERGSLGRSGDTIFPSSTKDLSRTSDLAPKLETTRKLLLDAVRDGDYESAIAYGRQLADGSFAAPNDLVAVAQSYFSVGDCDNARLWAQKARDAFQMSGEAPNSSLRRVILCCGRGLGNYELAISAIARGLKKGGIVHLDEAYIYLGRARMAVGDIEGARDAFNKLKDVPGISPRVVRLWTLYAETQLTESANWQCPKGRVDYHSP